MKMIRARRKIKGPSGMLELEVIELGKESDNGTYVYLQFVFSVITLLAESSVSGALAHNSSKDVVQSVVLWSVLQ
jgi:hypothetical protein